jgi:Zn-dependent peptidase ImmA (M78 family)
MQIDRMELADLGNPEHLAAAVLRQIPDLPIPVPVEAIARALDITEIRPLQTEGFEGGLITYPDKSEGIVLVNMHSQPRRQRFTVGHELGHFVNPWHKPKEGNQFLCTAEDMRRLTANKHDRATVMEVEANRFAAELLLPKEPFRKDLRRLAGPDMEHILRLAEKYDISREATGRRYVELNDDTCAILFSHDGRLRYACRSRDFPYLDIRSGDPLPAASLSVQSRAGQGEISDWVEIDAGIWLTTDQARQHGIVLEQTLAQRDCFRMTLLTLETDEIDEDEEGLEASWTPRFRR